MDELQQRLWQLAVAAKEHAREEHQLELSATDWAGIDRLLTRERDAAPAEPFEAPAEPFEAPAEPFEEPAEPFEETGERADLDLERSERLAACYGVWLGFWAVTALQGRWVGLHEPTAPRVRIGGETFSPIDAIRRILRNAS